jgi:magnesium chelatase subunit ChlD-like protein
LKPSQERWLWILSDGRSSTPPSRPTAMDRVVFVDFEQDGNVWLGRCAQLAREWNGDYFLAHQLLV